jgi:hypothetical protein
MMGLLQEQAVVLLAFLEGFLHGLAPKNFLFQLPIRSRQLHGAPAQPLV